LPTSEDNRFRALLESAPDAVVIVDGDGNISLVNQQTEKMFGYRREELLGKPVEMLVPELLRHAHARHRTAYSSRPRTRSMGAGLQLSGLRKDGTQLPVEISLSPVANADGFEVFSTIRDISSTRQLEEELRNAKKDLELRVKQRTAELAKTVQALEKEMAGHRAAKDALAREHDRAKSYLDIAEVMLLALDRSGRIVLINKKGLRLLGYKESQLRGKDWFDTCMPERNRAGARQVFDKLVSGEEVNSAEYPVLTRNGEERLVIWNNTLVRDGIGNVLGTLSSGEDVTERRRSEEAVKRLAAIVESSNDAIIGETLDGMILSWNGGAERLYGYSASEAIGHPITMIAPPERHVEMAELLERLKRGEHIRHFETWRVAKDGRRVDISLSVFLLRDGDGKPVAAANIARDITERKRLEEQLRQAQKMEAIGRLAGGVAHDFNNLLGVVQGESELLLAEKEIPERHRVAVGSIREAAERAASLTRQLLVFSRKQVLELQVLKLNQVLDGVEKTVRQIAGPEIAVQFKRAEDLACVRADPARILQVILNLVVNARDAMPGGGRIGVETANVTLDEAYAATHTGTSAGPHVMVSVADNGPGMSPEVLSHIFEPFYSTKDGEESLGLGLATAYGIVQQSGGSIWPYSEPGRGTTFKIFLPAATDATAPAEEGKAAAESPEEFPHGSETVLVVDDSRLLRHVTGEFLTRLGYTVLAAEDGENALAVAQKHDGEIHLLLTDLAMPGMNGQQLGQRMQAARPSIKVLYTSGYAGSVLKDHTLPEGGDSFLEKPFTWQNLATKVRQLLDR
jgi:two-component system cell cycle sensor histidine kinase/response regulator CckA